MVLYLFFLLRGHLESKALALRALFCRIVAFVAPLRIQLCVPISYVFGNVARLQGRAVKAYRQTSAIKSFSSVCVNMSWPDDFISRYLFVSWSTPPIINGPPRILKHADCVYVCTCACAVRVYKSARKTQTASQDLFAVQQLD